MLRVLTTEFDTSRRCERCDVVLSTSHFDTKHVALKISKNTEKARQYYQCIFCALKFKVSVNEVRKFLHLATIPEKVKEKRPRIFESNHIANKYLRGNHDGCINKSKTCTCFCHGDYS